MKIIVVCPGKLKDKWLKDGIDEYKKRLSRFATLDFIEVPDCPDSVPVNEALKREGELILSHIKPGEVVWAMDLGGENVTSEKLSQYLTADIEKGGGTLNWRKQRNKPRSPRTRRQKDMLRQHYAHPSYDETRSCRTALPRVQDLQRREIPQVSFSIKQSEKVIK